MVAPLNDLALLQNHNGLCVADSGQAVGDDEYGTALHEAVHALFDQFFGTRINGGSSFIQNQHRRICHRRPGNGQQLALALAEVAAVIGDPGVIALRQVADKGIRVGQTGSGADLLIGGIQLSVPDVVRNGSGKQVGVLKDNAQAPPQAVLADVPQINAVIGNQAALDLIKTVDQVGDGGLSRTGGANEGDLLAGLCVVMPWRMVFPGT